MERRGKILRFELPIDDIEEAAALPISSIDIVQKIK